MPKRILMDMLHIQIDAPTNLAKPVYAQMRRALNSKRFAADLRQLARSFIRRYSSLSLVRVTVFS